MFGWLFGGKKHVEVFKEEVKGSFSSVKNDINSISEWIKHLDKQGEGHKQLTDDFHVRLSSMENDMEGIKNMLALMDGKYSKRLFKHRERELDKQTAVEGVQEGIQTAVQTAEITKLGIQHLSTMERAIIVILLNTDMKLSYDDLAAMTGKSRATVRGQINTIKRKSEDLISEIVEKNGKKRVFVPDNIKEKLLKSVKVRVSKGKKTGKKVKIDEF